MHHPYKMHRRMHPGRKGQECCAMWRIVVVLIVAGVAFLVTRPILGFGLESDDPPATSTPTATITVTPSVTPTAGPMPTPQPTPMATVPFEFDLRATARSHSPWKDPS